MTDAGLTPADGDIRPVVARRAGHKAVWVFAGVLIVASVTLFVSLEARRTTIRSPAIAPQPVQGGPLIGAPPALVIPPDWEAMRHQRPVRLVRTRAPQPAPARSSGDASPLPVSPTYTGPFTGQVSPAPPVPQTPPWDPAGNTVPPPAQNDPAKTADGDRVHASTFANPSTTVPQGTVIQAVLETALNSSREGFARAVVSRDVHSFDGTRVLIPRGAKLFGEYGADVGRGQNRALIQWRRLTRPDGVIIDVDSPSADTLGRAGIKGKVDTHFLERFGGTILQSVLDIGVQLAVNQAAGDTVVVALPGSAPTVNPTPAADIRPTVKVRQGTSVSVFVARDLDFTDVER